MQATREAHEAGCWAALTLPMEWHVGAESLPREPSPFEIDDEAFESVLAGLPYVEPESPARLDDLEAVEVPSLWLTCRTSSSASTAGHPSRSRTGAGLGLSFARAVAYAHGGQITAASAPGGGSTFTVTLPERQGQSEMARR